MAVLAKGKLGRAVLGALEELELTLVPPYQVEIHDDEGDLLAVLENAYNVGYRMELNRVGGLGFSLPADDPKWRYIADGREVWLYENGVLVEVYRITRRRTARE